MRTAAIINQKGGCGKTTTAINLAGIFARRGARTLLVDMDPQSHCAAGLAIPEKRIDLDIGDAMVLDPPGRLDPSRLLWRVSRNLDLAPSRMKLAGLEASRGGLADRPDRDQRLRGVLGSLDTSYDVCVIDCSPSIGLLTYNAMIASDAVLIPVETSFFSLQGASKQISSIESLNTRLGTSLPHWLVPTIHDPASPLARDLLEELRRRFGDRVASVAVRQDSAVREAASFGLPVVDYAPGSTGAADHAALAQWLGERLGLRLPVSLELPELVESVNPSDAGGEDQPGSETGIPTTTAQSTVHVRRDPASARELAQRVARAESAADREARVDRDKASAAERESPTKDTHLPSPTGENAVHLDASDADHSDSGGGGYAQPSGGVGDGHGAGRAEDVVRRAWALQRRREGIGTPVHVDRRAEEAPPQASEHRRRDAMPSLTRLYGARPTTSGVLFVQPLSAGSSVSIAGSFNGWSASSHRMRANERLGVFELCVPLGPGRHVYRLVVDGRWTSDPHNPVSESNPFGETNSVVVVPAQPRSVAVPPQTPAIAAQRISHE